MHLGTISEIRRYPVKSMDGDRPAVATLDADGLVGDRTWALRDVETGKLVSAKRPRLWRPVLDCHATGTGAGVVVTLPSGAAHPIDDPALLDGLEALLGRRVSVETATGPQQGTYESDWPEIEGVSLSGEIELPTNLTGEGTSFIDLGILHVLSTASLASLAAAAPGARVDTRRFRPSFVIDTGETTGWPENEWLDRLVRIGDDVTVRLGIPAPRCVMTTVEQGDLPGDPGILQALARENRVTGGMGSFACLGCYATVEEPGEIATGDAVSFA